MARLNWTDQAILDLVNIDDFIAKDSVRYAKIILPLDVQSLKLQRKIGTEHKKCYHRNDFESFSSIKS